MMLLCVGVSWLCYQWLERPMRKGHDSYAKAIILAALMVGAGLVGVVTYMTNGLDGHGYRQAGKNEFAATMRMALLPAARHHAGVSRRV